jgi:alkylation response protein AidB-like acyl-CoA dehydrogenase
MDFSVTEDQQALVDLAREILADHVTHERLQAMEAEGWTTYDPGTWQRLADAGITGIAVPVEFGGAGLGFIEIALVCQQAGRLVAPVPAVWTLVTAHVLAMHAPAAAAGLLPGVASGEVLLSAALEAGGDVRATAGPEGWVLNGERGFVPYGGVADVVVVPAVSEDGTLVAALVPRDAPGLTVTELETTNREPQAVLGFDGVTLGTDAVIAAASELIADLRRHLTAALCCVVAGVCAAALERTAKHTSTREQFGKPIASFQAVGQRAADAYIDAELIELTALQAVWRLSAGWPAEEEIAVAKWWAGEGGMRVLHTCQHLHGGLGVDLDYPLHRYFLWGKQIEHELGTPTRQLIELGAHLADTPV